MKPIFVAVIFAASAWASPVPGLFTNDQVSQASQQKGWIDEFVNVFKGTSKLTSNQEKATTGPQVFDFKLGYDLVQGLLAKMFTATPIVDNIKEKDKYGNDGSMHAFIGNAVVKGSEALSKMINAAIDVPKLAARMVSNSITQALNGLGAKIVGL